MKNLLNVTIVCSLFITFLSGVTFSQVSNKTKVNKIENAIKKNPKQAKDILKEAKKHPRAAAKVAEDANNNPSATKRNYKAAKNNPKKYMEIKNDAKNNKARAKRKYKNNKGKLKNKSPKQNYKTYKSRKNRGYTK